MKIKQFVLFALILCLLTGTAQAAEKKAKKEKNVVIYNGEISRRYPTSYTNVYEQMDTESKKLTTMNAGQKIQITAVYPGWVAIKYGSGLGYVMRHRIDVTENVFPGTNPDYPITPQYYYAVIDRPVNVKADKAENSETISVLTEGARVSLCGMEDGWAVLIHKRQYGYINTNDLSELYPVAPETGMADENTPISVFCSFYSDNPDRIVNLGICCGHISRIVQPGEVMNFNDAVMPFSPANGYRLAPVLKDGETKLGYGGGSCQVSSTLWDALMQLPGITVLHRNPHGINAASYLPHGLDAASGTDRQNFIFRNDYDFPIRIDASTHDLALFVAIYRVM